MQTKRIQNDQKKSSAAASLQQQEQHEKYNKKPYEHWKKLGV